MGFKYREIIGEMIFSYVVVRYNMFYAMAELSKFVENNEECRYVEIKFVTRYLKQYPLKGIILWRK